MTVKVKFKGGITNPGERRNLTALKLKVLENDGGIL